MSNPTCFGQIGDRHKKTEMESSSKNSPYKDYECPICGTEVRL